MTSFNASSQGKKRSRPRELTRALRAWMERRPTPYSTLAEKQHVAEALNIPVAQVAGFEAWYRQQEANLPA